MGFKRRKGREEEEEEEAGNEDLTPTIRSLWWSVMWKGVSGSRCAPRHACSYIFASVSMKYWHYKEWEGDYKPPPPPLFPSIPLSSGHFTASEWDNPHTQTTNHTSILMRAEPITGRSTLPTFPKENLCIFYPLILTKEVQIYILSSQPLSHHFCKQASTQIQQYHH